MFCLQAGFPLAKLLDAVGPQPGARYIKFTSFDEPARALGQAYAGYPWPCE